ncbi:hypothetical protein BD560DRAFT_447164 [Blakeslea trispora]|nr:hypothetical protein BD560DRAFT_447164 [Blakeslea trispora]
MNHQIMNYEQPDTPLISEKLPSIDKLAKADVVSMEMKESAIPSYLPPPPNTFNSFHSGMMYPQHVSPPLTPAVSPSSMLFDSMNFKRKFSIDISPFGFGTNLAPSIQEQEAYRRSSCSAVSMESFPPEPAHSSPSMPASGYSVAVTAAVATAAQAAAAAQSASATRYPPDYTFLNASLQPHSLPIYTPTTSRPTTTTTTTTKPSRRGTRPQPGPNTQHKHACKYPYCTWSFKRYEHLKRHMLVHTGKRPHVCHFPGCGKSFSRSDNFHAHYRTHTKKANLLQTKESAKQEKSMTTEQVDVCENSTLGSSPIDSEVMVQSFEERPFYGNTQVRQASPFDMTPYQDMYADRYHSEEPYQQQYMRHFPQQLFASPTTSASDDLHSTMTSPISPSGTSLLNHEHQAHSSLYLAQTLHSSPPSSRFNYPMVSPNNPSPYAYQNYPDDTMSIVPVTLNEDSTTPAVKSTGKKSSHRSTTRKSSTSNQQKSHICPVTQCQRRFKRLEHLKRHMRIHTLERPFGCSFPNCHKTFSRSDNLSQHMKTHQRVEDRRRKQPRQDNLHSKTTNLPPLNYSNQPTQASNSSNMMANMSWHSTSVGC